MSEVKDIEETICRLVIPEGEELFFNVFSLKDDTNAVRVIWHRNMSDKLKQNFTKEYMQNIIKELEKGDKDEDWLWERLSETKYVKVKKNFVCNNEMFEKGFGGVKHKEENGLVPVMFFGNTIIDFTKEQFEKHME